MGCCVSLNEEGEYLCCSSQGKKIDVEHVFHESTSEFNHFNSSSSIIMFESIRGDDTCRESEFSSPQRMTPFGIIE